MDSPKVSIIVPVYNKEKYIQASLQSICRQDYQDYEVWIINDGSTDESGQIARAFARNDARFHVADIPNGGVSNARNTGLGLAKGKWLQFLDADDLLAAGYLSRAVEIAEQNDAEILFTDFSVIDESGKRLREVASGITGAMNQAELCETFADVQYRNGFFGFISNKLICRRLVEQSKARFPTDTRLAEDLMFYVQLYRKAQRVYFCQMESFSYLHWGEANYANDIYYSQLEIQMAIKEWFLEAGFYEKYCRLLDETISDYVFYTLFYLAQDGRPIDDAYAKIVSDDAVLRSIHPEYTKGFRRLILQCVRKKSLPRVKRLLTANALLHKAYHALLHKK